MEQSLADKAPTEQRPPLSGGHKRHAAGTSLLSRIPFMRGPADQRSRHDIDDDLQHPREPSLAAALQQQKTRRRRGSLRKVALLGRSSQRERRDAKSSGTEPRHDHTTFSVPDAGPTSAERTGLDITPRPSMEGYAAANPPLQPLAWPPPSSPRPMVKPIAIPARELSAGPALASPSYSTTDDEGPLLHVGRGGGGIGVYGGARP